MKGQLLYRRARKRIPGGTQLLSKRPELFLPEQWPAYYARARGVEVTDLDGRTYIDMSLMGVGACVLGYADPDVDRAVLGAVSSGVMCTLNAPEEVELAELLCGLHPWSGMVRYARTGGEAVSIAVRIARAFTGRDKVAFCGYHGWSDWYLAANLSGDEALEEMLMPGLEPAGVPSSLRGTALPFHYNRIQELAEIIDQHPGQIAAIVMEPRRGTAPLDGFLEEVRRIATESGAILVFDEITTGFRATAGGIHRLLHVDPDLAIFAKAIANGYAMAAVIGRDEVMEAAQSSFISSTNWTERIGPTAALATIEKFRRVDAAGHLMKIGEQVRSGWVEVAARAQLPLKIEGLPGLLHFSFDSPLEVAMMTLFTQLMLERGFLAFNQFKPSYAHTEEHVFLYLDAVSESFQLIERAFRLGNWQDLLRGPVAGRGFFRLTT